MGLLADKYLKGAKNICFRYGGPGCEMAKGFYEMGLLSDEPVEVDGAPVVPMRLVSKLTPPAPKYKQEIQNVIDEGIESDEGIFLVRVDGKMDGGDVRIGKRFGRGKNRQKCHAVYLRIAFRCLVVVH